MVFTPIRPTSQVGFLWYAKRISPWAATWWQDGAWNTEGGDIFFADVIIPIKKITGLIYHKRTRSTYTVVKFSPALQVRKAPKRTATPPTTKPKALGFILALGTYQLQRMMAPQ